MIASKLPNGELRLTRDPVEGAVDSFIFDWKDFPSAPDDRSYEIKANFETKKLYMELVEEPEPVEPEPTAQDDTDAMLIDHEYRLTMLELGLEVTE